MKKWILWLALPSILFADPSACGCVNAETMTTTATQQTHCGGNDLTDAMEALERGEFEIAVAIFKTLAEQGNFIAEQNLGVMYHNGYGVPKNLKMATYWFDKAEETWKAKKSLHQENLCSDGMANKIHSKTFVCQNIAVSSY